MEALGSGERFGNVSFNVTVTLASNAVETGQRSITYCRVRQVVETTTGISNVYAQNAIIRRGGVFLVISRHP